jgi:hypothetical protein
MLDVQVVNHTMLRLNIGERTSLNRDVKIIHTLAPHESFCLSACRSEPGLICFQPAGKLQHSIAHGMAAVSFVFDKTLCVWSEIPEWAAGTVPVIGGHKVQFMTSCKSSFAGEQDETSHYQWSPSIRLQPLLDLVQPSGAGSSPDRNRAPRVARHLACQAAQGGLLQSSFCVGVVPSRTRAGEPCCSCMSVSRGSKQRKLQETDQPCQPAHG